MYAAIKAISKVIFSVYEQQTYRKFHQNPFIWNIKICIFFEWMRLCLGVCVDTSANECRVQLLVIDQSKYRFDTQHNQFNFQQKPRKNADLYDWKKLFIHFCGFIPDNVFFFFVHCLPCQKWQVSNNNSKKNNETTQKLPLKWTEKSKFHDSFG